MPPLPSQRKKVGLLSSLITGAALSLWASMASALEAQDYSFAEVFVGHSYFQDEFSTAVIGGQVGIEALDFLHLRLSAADERDTGQGFAEFERYGLVFGAHLPFFEGLDFIVEGGPIKANFRLPDGSTSRGNGQRWSGGGSWASGRWTGQLMVVRTTLRQSLSWSGFELGGSARMWRDLHLVGRLEIAGNAGLWRLGLRWDVD